MDSTLYDQSNKFQKMLITNFINSNQSEIETYFQSNKEKLSKLINFNYIDYGCATGKNTIDLFNLFYSQFKKLNPEASFTITLSDLPTNDFKITYNCFINSMQKQSTYENDIYHRMVIGSFYDNLLPPKSADLITCNASIHWLRMEDEEFFKETKDNPLYMLGDEGNQKITQVSKENYLSFLINRYKELKDDGLLIISGPLDIENKKKSRAELIFNVWVECLKKLNLEKLKQYMAVKTYIRNLNAFLEPLKNQENKEKDFNYEILKYETKEIKVPIDSEESFISFLNPFFSYNFQRIKNEFYKKEYGKDIDDKSFENLKYEFFNDLKNLFTTKKDEVISAYTYPIIHLILKKISKNT
jgi:hypothetical protein